MRIPMLIRTGLGLGSTNSTLVSASGAAAGSTVSLIAQLLPASAIGGPIGIAIGGAIAAISGLLGVLGVGNGCGQSCVVASNNANSIESQMQANLAAFQAGSISQATAEANYQTLWNQFVAMCTQVQGANSACITDRQQGACKWKDASGNCWNWYVGYYLPIANAAPAPTAALSSIFETFTAPEWVLIGGIVIGAAVVLS
jgi:hypothetical protein